MENIVSEWVIQDYGVHTKVRLGDSFVGIPKSSRVRMPPTPTTPRHFGDCVPRRCTLLESFLDFFYEALFRVLGD